MSQIDCNKCQYRELCHFLGITISYKISVFDVQCNYMLGLGQRCPLGDKHLPKMADEYSKAIIEANELRKRADKIMSEWVRKWSL